MDDTRSSQPQTRAPPDDVVDPSTDAATNPPMNAPSDSPVVKRPLTPMPPAAAQSDPLDLAEPAAASLPASHLETWLAERPAEEAVIADRAEVTQLPFLAPSPSRWRSLGPWLLRRLPRAALNLFLIAIILGLLAACYAPVYFGPQKTEQPWRRGR